MRILLSCQQALKPHAVPAYAFWQYYLRSGLAEAGHEVIEVPGVDWAEGLTPMSKEERAGWLERTWTRTVEFLRPEHRKAPVSMFLGYLFPDQVNSSAVGAICDMGIPTVNFFCDNIREFTRIPSAFHPFDLHWVPEADARRLYAAAGLRFVYAPMPMWVRPEYRGTPASESGGPVFIGSRDDLREDLLGHAVSLGLDVTVRGAGWGNGPGPEAPAPAGFGQKIANQFQFLRKEGLWGFAMRESYRRRPRRDTSWIPNHAAASPSDEEYFRALRECRVAIGINRFPSFRRPFHAPLVYSRLRDIEAPMLGASYLTEAAPGLEDLFEIGSEIETYATAGELVEKARRLEADPALRLRLRLGGQRRALAEHTIGRTIARIAAALSIPA